MEFQTNGSSFLSGMREEGADSAHSSPLFPARSPTTLPTSSLFQPLVPPFGQDYSPDLFSGYHHFTSAEPDFPSELGFKNSGLSPPPPTSLPPMTDLLRSIDENWLAPPDAFDIFPLEEAIASEVTDDVFLGLPGSSFLEMMEDARTPSFSYDALRSPFIPNIPILAEDATSLLFPLAESLPPSSALVDFSSWSTSTLDAMYYPEADATLSLPPPPPPPSSRLHEEYGFPTMVPSSFPGLVPLPFDSDTRGFEWAQLQRDSERDSWVDQESYEDGCSMRCPRCGWSASTSTSPLDPFESWPRWLYG